MPAEDQELHASGFRPPSMTRVFWTILLLTLILCACSPGGITSEPSTVTPPVITPFPEVLPGSTPAVLPPPRQIATLATPHIEQGPDGALTAPPTSSQGCAYQWAYQDLLELSGQFLAMLQQVQPEAQGSAYAFGEDCIRDDGSVTFLPMETDFNVILQVSALSDEAALGDWVIQVMQVVESIPPEQIVGPRPGRVSLIFEAGGESTGINFYVDQYRALPASLSSAEIYRLLQESQ